MTIDFEEDEALRGKMICFECIGESYMSAVVEEEGEVDECSYCEEEQATITMEEFCDHIDGAFEQHYSRTSQEPNSYEYAMLRDREISYDWYRDGDKSVDIIADAAQISEAIAQDAQAILDYRHSDRESAEMGLETEFSDDAHYEEIMPRDWKWQEQWDEFERLIKKEARFFSRTAASHLGELFDKIDEMRTRSGRSLVVDAGPDTPIDHLHRARPFQSEDALLKAIKRPDLELSAPPAWAASSGRMNARGISVFYGATAPEIAIAEVRPPVGSWVAVGRFNITRPIRLLDLTALGDLQEDGSIFDPGYAERLTRMMFLRTLCALMARPVMPDDQELEYLPTQAIADYLSTEGQVPLDGILFPSVQLGGDGLNVVLFHKASRCEELGIPQGTDITARTYMNYEDGPEPDFSVTEEVPPVEDDDEDSDAEQRGAFASRMLGWPEDYTNADNRDVTLRIDIDEVFVHEVQAVDIRTRVNPVRRSRWEKRELPF
ncbi:RES domain-containing protein [Cognatishimia activa]|uniref:RES domain-containing protein n=1 Tax=Cognatishimia activa TaxID=1715691 RepID=UPI0006EF2967|nr:RES domain-containing protein [Cognatishimia activa]CUJ30121.1 RES domain protein [Cognatishimia activa]